MRNICWCVFLSVIGTSSFAKTVTLASWNLEWFQFPALTPQQYSECKEIDGKPEQEVLKETDPYRWTCKGPLQIKAMQDIARTIDADIIAVQEVDSVEALQLVWPKEEYDFFVNMKSPWLQRTGFVVRKDIKTAPSVDLAGLALPFKGHHARSGLELPVNINGVNIKLLSVHLKSGCFDKPLNSGYVSWRDKQDGLVTCDVLRDQGAVLEKWLDDSLSNGAQTIIIGDFNRRFDSEAEKSDDIKESMLKNLSDGEPADANLFRPTEGLKTSSECRVPNSDLFIDHALMSAGLQKYYIKGSLYEIKAKNNASDHCAIVFKMKF